MSEQVDHFVHGRERAPVVPERDLDAEALGHQEDVLCGLAAHGGGREAVVARVHPGVRAFGREGAHLGEQVLDRTGDEVGAGDPHEARGAAGDELREHEFGRARDRTALAAASGHVDVLVEKAGREDFALRVDRFEPGQGHLEVRPHRKEAARRHEDVVHAEVVGRVDAGVLDQNGLHVHVSLGEGAPPLSRGRPSVCQVVRGKRPRPRCW